MNDSLRQGSRVRVIDAIRGFSLLGILLSNMLIFQYGMYGKGEMHQFDPSRWDHVVHSLLQIFVEGSFMPIFMFLFGYGLIKLRNGLIQKELKPARILVRRFLMLAALGLIHGMLLWEGDILLAYGLCGFVLLLFIKRKVKTLIVWGVILSLLVAGLSIQLEKETPKEAERMQQYVEQSIQVYGNGSYLEIMDFRVNEDPLDIPDEVLLAIMVLALFIMLSMFLFGMSAAKMQWFHHPQQERRRHVWLAVILAPLGLLLKTIAILQKDEAWSGALLALGAQLLALGYIFGLSCLLSIAAKRSLFVSAFEAVGRMSLTNYLMQTVICTAIFYGYGLGWFGQIGVLNGILLALLIYALQAAASSYLLRRFKSGPIEWILRIWTYFSFSGRPRYAHKSVSAAD